MEFGVQLFDQHVLGLSKIVDLVKSVLSLFFFSEGVCEFGVKISKCGSSPLQLKPLVLPHGCVLSCQMRQNKCKFLVIVIVDFLINCKV